MSGEVIPAGEVDFHPLSFVEKGARLFRWRGDLYRAVDASRAAFTASLFDRGLIDRLARRGLIVATERSSVRLEGYDLVMRHATVPFPSYVFEWPREMLRDAALAVLDLEAELSREQLTLHDAHPWNVLFDGCRPLWVDVGSIEPAGSGGWPAADEFRRFYTNPLRLMSAGYDRVARWLLHDYAGGVHDGEVSRLTTDTPLAPMIAGAALRRASRRLPAVVSLVRRGVSLTARLRKRGHTAHVSRPAQVAALRREIEAIPLPAVETRWSAYYGDEFPPFEPGETWHGKHRAVHTLLERLRPTSVLDLGANRGWYARLAESLGARVVATDVDPIVVGLLYEDCRRHAPSILPLVLDVVSPTPGYGILDQLAVPAVERLGCDLVLALGLSHHLLLRQPVRYEHLVAGLAAFTRRWAIVEFVPREDEHVSRWPVGDVPWYSLDVFREALSRQFRVVETVASHPSPRVLILCEKA